MTSLAAILAPLALLLPVVAVPAADEADGESVVRNSQVAEDQAFEPIPLSRRQADWQPFVDPAQTPEAAQVRIERRVIIRITPRPGPARQSLTAEQPAPQSRAPRYVERAMGECLDTDDISGVQVGRGNRLMLYMRDRNIVSLRLERACAARDFYSGFYLERSSDGQLCVDRDRLLSRGGSQCRVSGMARLVAVQPD